MKLISIDNGHGLNTPGKRTPTMPDGRIIKEWEFNHSTAKKLGELLKFNGFDVLFVSDTEEDTSLEGRTNKANQAKADIFVSIHFNAFKGIWGSHGGIETLYAQGSANGLKLANLVQKELIEVTGLRDRGAKARNDLWVLNKTTMPAVLAECGFMDNLDEAKLMLDEDYQVKCARAIAKGICKYFGVEYREAEYHEDMNELDAIKILLHGKELKVEGIYKYKTNYIPVRFLESLGYIVGWQDGTVVVEYNDALV